MSELIKIRNELRAFAAERDWDQFLSPKNLASALAAIVENTYRTLMTRGMKGCFVYFTDSATAAHFRARIAYRRRESQAKPELRMVADKAKDQP